MATKSKGAFPDNYRQLAAPVIFVVCLALLMCVALVAAAMMARGAL